MFILRIEPQEELKTHRSGLKGIDLIIIPNLSQKVQKNAEKSILRYGGNVSQNIRGL